MNETDTPDKLDWDQHVTDGIEAADKSTALMLSKVSACAREAYGHLGMADGVGEIWVKALIVRMLPKYSGTDVRAALVELHTRGLIEFRNEGETLSKHGTWGAEVSKVLGGRPGSALFPVWRGINVGREPR